MIARHAFVVICDALRADRLPLYGYGRRTAPFLERLARESWLYRDAAANACWTLASHATLFTGLLPWRHGATARSFHLREDVPTLAETASAAGMATALISGNSFLSPAFNVTRGFGDVVNLLGLPDDEAARRRWLAWSRRLPRWAGPLRRRMRDALVSMHRDDETGAIVVSAAAVNRAVRDWVARHRRERMLCVVNYMDVHSDLIPHENRFDPARPPSPRQLIETTREYNFGRPFDRGVLAAMSELYDSAVCYLDGRLRELVHFLASCGVLDESLLIVTADHGEMLGEHGFIGHVCLREPNLRVPLLVRWPGGGPRVIDATAVLADVAPTVWSALGLSMPPDLEGVDLAAPFWPEAASRRTAAAQKYPGDLWRILRGERVMGAEFAVRRGAWKLHSHRGERNLYDLSVDPGEQRPIDTAAQPAVSAPLVEECRRYEERDDTPADNYIDLFAQPDRFEALDMQPQRDALRVGGGFFLGFRLELEPGVRRRLRIHGPVPPHCMIYAHAAADPALPSRGDISLRLRPIEERTPRSNGDGGVAVRLVADRAVAVKLGPLHAADPNDGLELELTCDVAGDGRIAVWLLHPRVVGVPAQLEDERVVERLRALGYLE